MTRLPNAEIAKILIQIRTLMEFAGEPFFKFMAYERAAETLENAPPVAELAAAGVASILVPLTVSTTSHQRDNAAYMYDAGAAIHLPQPDLSPEALAQLLRGLDRKRLLTMAIAARAIAEPDATKRVAALCEEMAKR